MTERVQVGGLQIAKVLHDFVEQEAIPGTGVDSAAFWAGADKLIADLAPRNKELLAKRDEIQGKLDAWHGEHPGAGYDRAAYKAHLQEIGYLLPEPAEFAITTENVDDEIQQFLCGIFNSYVANYLVRLRVTTHVSAAIVDRLPVPTLPISSSAFASALPRRR